MSLCNHPRAKSLLDCIIITNYLVNDRLALDEEKRHMMKSSRRRSGPVGPFFFKRANKQITGAELWRRLVRDTRRNLILSIEKMSDLLTIDVAY